jgi:glycosyltransferase involved in cell wall biosynthesis
MSKKKRVMHVAWGLDKGGVEEQLFIIAKYNLKQKYDLAFTTWSTKEGTISQEIEKLGYPVYGMNITRRVHDLRVIPRLMRIFHLFQPDIVHFYTKIGFVGRIVAKIARIPIIICNEVDLFTKEPGLDLMLLLILKRRTDFLADRIIACSKAVREHWDRNNSDKYLVMYLPIDTEKITTFWDESPQIGNEISSMVNADSMPSNAHGAKENSLKGFPENGLSHNKSQFRNGFYPVIGIVSRVYPGKGHEYLIKAMPMILKAYPAAKLRIIGTGVLLAEMKALALSLNLDSSVEFKGFVDNLYSELNKLDIFVLPSLSEGFPLCIMEAMAMGIPVAATPVGGIPELIVHEKTGVLFDTRNPDSLAETVIKLLADFNKTKLMGLRGKEKVINEFSPEVYVKNLDSLYQDLLVEKGLQ